MMPSQSPRQWFRKVGPEQVSPETKAAAQRVMEFVAKDLGLPDLEIQWCVPESAESADREKRERTYALRYEPPQCFTEEAYCFLSRFLYLLASSTPTQVIRDVAFRAKAFQLWSNPQRWMNEPLFDFNEEARKYALNTERYVSEV